MKASAPVDPDGSGPYLETQRDGYTFGIVDGRMTWLGDHPMTEDEAREIIDALLRQFPTAGACDADSRDPDGSRIEIEATAGDGFVHLHVSFAGACVQLPLVAREAKAVGDALIRHGDEALSPRGSRRVLPARSTAFSCTVQRADPAA